MARVLITGASGFIGSHLARACLARGDAVSVLLRPGSSLRRLDGLASRLQVFRLHLTSAPALAACLADARPGVIFHAGSTTRYAAEDPASLTRSVEDNLLALTTLLAEAAKAPEPPQVLLRLGTIAEYGDIEVPFRESDREQPRGAYGVSALACTQYMAAAQPQLPFTAVTARLALTYGPGQSADFLIPQLARNLLAGRPTTLRRPQDRRELIYVGDAVAGLLQIADAPEKVAPLVNLGTGQAPRMAAAARLLARAGGAPETLIRQAAQPGPPSELRASPDLLNARLGWRAPTSLTEGFERMLQWERRNLADRRTAQA